jgi:hypothetical protein
MAVQRSTAVIPPFEDQLLRLTQHLEIATQEILAEAFLGCSRFLLTDQQTRALQLWALVRLDNKRAGVPRHPPRCQYTGHAIATAKAWERALRGPDIRKRPTTPGSAPAHAVEGAVGSRIARQSRKHSV